MKHFFSISFLVIVARLMTMPKRTERWSDLPVPATPLQRGTYLDACTARIVAEPDTNTTVTLDTPTSDPIHHTETGCDDVVARSPANVRDTRNWLCIVCRKTVSDPFGSHGGNPFAQQCLVVTCQACRCA